MRAKIIEYAEEKSCFSIGEIKIDEGYFGTQRVYGKRGRRTIGKTKVFGMKKTRIS